MTRQATRRHMGTIAGALALTAGLLGAHTASAATQAQAPRHKTVQYSFRIVASPQDATFTQLLGINDHQAIAGYDGSGQTVDGVLHPNKGFTLTLPSTFTPENYPASMQTQVIGINNHGDTAGFYIDAAGATHGFVEHNGRFSTTDLPGTPFNQLLGLNNQGQAAGYFQDAAGLNHAYVRDGRGVYTVLPLPNSQATGINDRGVVVGFTQATTTTSSAFVWQNERATLLSYPGSTFTQALGENDQGQIVGTYNDAAGNGHGFVYGHGAFQTLDAPGASGTVVNGINDRGQIVGFFTDAAGNTVGFVGTPGTGHGSTGGMGGTGGQPTTIDIGLVLPLSGQDAALGLSAERGAQLAIDQANAARLVPSVTFTLVPKDDVGASGLPDAATGASGVKALIADARVAGIIGAFDTPTALAELPLANQAPIALISPSAGNPCLTSADPALGCSGANDLLPTVRPTGTTTFFRTLPIDPQQGSAQANYLYNTRHDKTAYVIYDTTAYGAGVANAFSGTWQRDGGTVLGRASVQEGTASFVNLLTQIAVTKPDTIFFGGQDPASGTSASILIRQQMLQIPVLNKTAFAGGDGIRTQQFAQTIGVNAGGPVWSTLTPADAGSLPAASTVAQQYQTAFGALGRYSASGYDSANVLIAAIKAALAGGLHAPTSATATSAATTFRQAVIVDAARTDMAGVTGTLSFTATGDLAHGLIGVEQLTSVNGTPGWKQVATQSVP